MSKKKSKGKKKKQPTTHEHHVGGHELSDKPQVHVDGTIEASIHPDLVEKYDAGQRKQDSREGVKRRIEIATLIIVFAYTTVAFWQGCSAKKSADAAIETAKISRESLEDVQGAVVSFAPDIRPIQLSSNPVTRRVEAWQLAVPFSNSGSTRTKNGQDYLNVFCPEKPIPDDYDFHDVGDKGSGPFALGPKQSVYTRAITVPIDCINGVRNHTNHLYLYGWATYRDIFRNTPDRRTEFCYEMVQFVDLAVPVEGKNSQLEWSLCQHHNCYDEECRK